jgi:D-tyrosyl-tRNA(Tyr) deacylase
MRAILQRVLKAEVIIDNKRYSKINNGLLLLLGIGNKDESEDIKWLIKKICQLRIFGDSERKLNLNINEINGEILIVSQFTLFASTKKGNRPGFSEAATNENASRLYDLFVSEMKIQMDNRVKTGIFGADMNVSLINEGPVTILIDTKNKE